MRARAHTNKISESGSPDFKSEPEPAPDFRRGYFVRFPDGSLVKIEPPAPEWVRITVKE